MNHDPTYNWLDDASKASLPEVVEALGLKQGRQSFGPCPHCGAETREKGRTRHPIGMTTDRQGWHCFPCGLSGNVINLVCLSLLGSPKAQRGQWQQVRHWFASYQWCQGLPGQKQATPPRLLKRKPAPKIIPKDYSKALRLFKGEVQEFWLHALEPLSQPSKASENALKWLSQRGFADQYITNITDHDLARILPHQTSCPKWARFAGQPWNKQGYHLIFPAFNSQGEIASLRARKISKSSGPKSIAPDGAGAFPTARNFVQANDIGQLLLETGKKPEWWTENVPIKIVVVEGEPDFLSWAARVSDADEHPLAVFGIWSGAWTDEIAARIPEGSRIIIRTDHDKAGNRYAEKVRSTLSKRCIVLRTENRT